jgi:hypothetical protein
MKKQQFITPIAEARWSYLLTARKQYDETKPPAFSTELLMPSASKEAQTFLKEMQEQFDKLHGLKAKRSQYAFPWGPDKEQGAALTVVKFKQAEMVNKTTGETFGAPKVVDANNNPWDGRSIGNGSKLRIKFDIYDWNRSAGCGISFQPKAVQVVELIEYEREGDGDGFDVVPGGFAVGAESDPFAGAEPLF